MAMGKYEHPGQPPVFKSVEELQEKIDAYWEYCKEGNKPLTMSGLAYYIGVDRRTLVNYSNKEQFFPTIKAAKERIQLYAEECLYDGSRKNQAGVIFSMKNNFGYVDQQDINATIKGSYSIKLPDELEEEESKGED